MALEIRVSNLLPLISFATRQGGASQADMEDVQADIAALQAEKADKVRTITGSNLATGGGSLAADRVINVQRATSASVAAGINDDAAVTPFGLKPSLDAIRNVTITGATLATGGGDLTANRVITVPKATGAEAAAGTNDTKAVTPLALKTPLDTLTGIVNALNAKFENLSRGIAEDSMSFSAWVAAHPEITEAALFEPQDIRTLFQDQAGTIPVTAPGQPVKRVKNKLSATGRHDMIHSSLTINAIYQVDPEGVGYIDMVAGSVLASDPMFTITDPWYWQIASKRSDDVGSLILAGMGQDNGDAIILHQPNAFNVTRDVYLARTGTTQMMIPAPYKMDAPEHLHIFDGLVRPNFFSSWVDGRPTPSVLNIDDELFQYTSGGAGTELFGWNYTSSTGIQRDRHDTVWPQGTTLTGCRFGVNNVNVGVANPLGTGAYHKFYGCFGCTGAAPTDEDRARMFDFWRKRLKMNVLDESDYDLFGFVGDSNMHGTTDDETAMMADLPLRTDGAIYNMHGMLSSIFSGTQHFAPGSGSLGGSMLGPFAKHYYAMTGRRALVLGFGMSTRGLVRPTTASYPSVFTPGGALPLRMVRQTQRAIDHVTKELGRKVEFRGIISSIGAYDAGVAGVTSTTYKATIEEFVARLRTLYGIPDLPYFMISVDSNTGMEASYAIIRNGQIAATNPANGIYMACPYQDFLDIVTGTRWPDEMMAGAPHWNQRAHNVVGQITGEFCGNLFKPPIDPGLRAELTPADDPLRDERGKLERALATVAV